jgi:hypothetical protein
LRPSSRANLVVEIKTLRVACQNLFPDASGVGLVLMRPRFRDNLVVEEKPFGLLVRIYFPMLRVSGLVLIEAEVVGIIWLLRKSPSGCFSGLFPDAPGVGFSPHRGRAFGTNSGFSGLRKNPSGCVSEFIPDARVSGLVLIEAEFSG